MNIIIFSKDRACQCDLTLTSLYKNAPALCGNVSVLYTGSDKDYNKGYDKLISKWKKEVNFVKQTNFQENLISLAHTTFPFNCFFTDDDIIYREIGDVAPIYSVLDSPRVACFSLRLGRNITVQDFHRKVPIVEPSFQYYGNVLIWDWRQAMSYTNYAYPLSVDGHIFRTEDITRLLDKFSYDNPNSFEGRIQQFNKELPTLMTSFDKSVVVNTPLNRVQETCTNLAGLVYGVMSQDLNNYWLDGYTLSLERMDYSNIYGCHQELPIFLSKKVI
jgi:hypothetical protein